MILTEAIISLETIEIRVRLNSVVLCANAGYDASTYHGHAVQGVFKWAIP